VDKQGHRRDNSSAYLRRTYRVEGKVKNETVANLSALPADVLEWIDAGLKGEQLVPADAAATITRSLPHGHVAAVHAQAKAVGLDAAQAAWRRIARQHSFRPAAREVRTTVSTYQADRHYRQQGKSTRLVYVLRGRTQLVSTRILI
jgi:hypothetical protein